MNNSHHFIGPPTAVAPEGRVTVEGVIKNTKHVVTEFGGSWKMTVELDTRARVYCTIPQGCAGQIGERVKFTATFERSKTDPFFAFGKIPKLYVEKPAKAKKAKAKPAPAAEPELPIEQPVEELAATVAF